MRRIKIMVVTLLPLLWLGLAACGSAGVSGVGSSHGCPRASVSVAAGHSQHGAAGDICFFKQALRNTNRRAGMSCDPTGKSLPVVASASGLLGLQTVPVLFSVVEAPADLLRCWQFYARTASEPRAPSAVSC